jgi:hypothetical protein
MVKPGVIFVVCNIQRCSTYHLVQTIPVKVKLFRFRGDDLFIVIANSGQQLLIVLKWHGQIRCDSTVLGACTLTTAEIFRIQYYYWLPLSIVLCDWDTCIERSSRYLLFLNDVVKPGVIFVVCNIQRCRSCHLVQTITVKVKLCCFRGDDLSIHVYDVCCIP